MWGWSLLTNNNSPTGPACLPGVKWTQINIGNSRPAPAASLATPSVSQQYPSCIFPWQIVCHEGVRSLARPDWVSPLCSVNRWWLAVGYTCVTPRPGMAVSNLIRTIFKICSDLHRVSSTQLYSELTTPLLQYLISQISDVFQWANQRLGRSKYVYLTMSIYIGRNNKGLYDYIIRLMCRIVELLISP